MFFTFAALLALPEDALAWGIGAHMAIAERTLDSLLAVSGHNAYMTAALKNVGAFLMGSIAPDIYALREWFFKTPKPLLHNWELALRLLENAKDEEEAAFSLGFISHLSSDVICHNFFIPQYIFMWDHRLELTHVFAETQVEGYLGRLEADRLNMMMEESRCLNSFFVRAAGLDEKTFGKNRALTGKTLSFKEKIGIDGAVFKWSANGGHDFIRRVEEHLKLSVELSALAIKEPLNGKAMSYCPEGELRISLSRLRRKVSIRSKKAEAFRREREAGKYDYMHRVPRHLVVTEQGL